LGNSNKCFNQFTKAIALRDFEDAVQLACAMDQGLMPLSPAMHKMRAAATLPILSASELLESLS
jgi:hypothetical protein